MYQKEDYKKFIDDTWTEDDIRTLIRELMNLLFEIQGKRLISKTN